MSSHTTTTHPTSPTDDPAYRSTTALPLHTHTLCHHTHHTSLTPHTPPQPTPHPILTTSPHHCQPHTSRHQAMPRHPLTHTHTHMSATYLSPHHLVYPLAAPNTIHSYRHDVHITHHRSISTTPLPAPLLSTHNPQAIYCIRFGHHGYNTTCMHSLTSQPRCLPSSSSNSPCHTPVNICLDTTCPSLVIPAHRPPDTHTTHPHQTTITTYSPP